VLNIESKDQIIAYRDGNRLRHYEPAIFAEILIATENGDAEILALFRRSGDSFRSIIINVHAYRKGPEFGFTAISFDD
jgi:hypothetical protein